MWEAIAGGASDIAGSIIQNDMNRSNAHQAQNWQERMDSSKYQRTVADMRAAGLNPLLAFQQGAASMGGSPVAATVNPIGNAVHSALDVMRTKQDLANLKAVEDKTKSDTALNRALTINANKQADILSNDAKFQTYKMPGAKTESKIDRGRWGTFTRYLDRIMAPLGGGAGTVGAFNTAKSIEAILPK